MDLRTIKEFMSTIQNLARIGRNMDLSMTWSLLGYVNNSTIEMFSVRGGARGRSSPFPYFGLK
jgi:hypothetical protein